ncbi:uncharacterized protein LY89DRAFT_781801 [Mollisia scopiformis]|uniref:cysteine dioxygenase n=1 Tax=Mollisia scopiformis TaxID=149040 RepID=A0A194XBV2_MOLSC|nr:uncharacterized protein LY89DRAFT_781801 [Mollisia scopiformis]KUJ17636.1 hypothetical protein LY89DRAFT_781801 [Mollisia scopiformis]
MPFFAPHRVNESDHQLLVMGQGTVAVTANAEKISFSFKTKTEKGHTLTLEVRESIIDCFIVVDGKRSSKKSDSIKWEKLREGDLRLLEKGVLMPYWVSFDNVHGVICYGKYSVNRKMAILQANLKCELNGIVCWMGDHQWMDALENVQVQVWHDASAQSIPKIKIHRLPVFDVPAIVLPGFDTLGGLESGHHAALSDLPRACQDLYQTIQSISLASEFPDFANAVHRSVSIKGLIGHTLLTMKATTFSAAGNFLSTYLRITLGQNIGNSPGIPNVLEIWPAGHFSPIHDHGDSHAIIKVLHGEIEVSNYDSVTGRRRPQQIGDPLILKTGDVTWIGPENYQIYRLHNKFNDVCITLQCYRYDEATNYHHNKFRWVEENAQEAEVERRIGPEHVFDFVPNGDMTYTDFCESIQEEWNSYQQTLPHRWNVARSQRLMTTR